MDEKRVMPVWVSAVFIVLILAAIIVNIFLMPQESEMGIEYVLLKIADCAACLAALLYCAAGFRKESSRFFLLFGILYLISVMMQLFPRAMELDRTFSSILLYASGLCAFGVMCVFTVAKNLGRKKSLILALILFVCSVLDVFLVADYALMVKSGVPGKVILSLLFLVMNIGKYRDKVARGRSV